MEMAVFPRPGDRTLKDMHCHCYIICMLTKIKCDQLYCIAVLHLRRLFCPDHRVKFPA